MSWRTDPRQPPVIVHHMITLLKAYSGHIINDALQFQYHSGIQTKPCRPNSARKQLELTGGKA
jgi:hypothetical protein